MQIDIVSDTICPWCFIGKRKLENAFSLRPDLKADIRWRPFQLNPEMPSEGADRKAYLDTKFGSPDRARAIYERIRIAGAEIGLDFDFARIKRTPNTLRSHCLIRWSAAAGAQDKVVESLFRRYFFEGEDISDIQVLKNIAESAGMDSELVGRLLTDSADIGMVQEEDKLARALGITGVPFFIVDDKYGVPGAQEPEALLQVIDRALGDANKTSTD